MNPLRKIDDWLLDDVYQPVSDQVEDWTNQDNRWQAIYLFSAAMLLSTVEKGNIDFWSLPLMILLFAFLAFFPRVLPRVYYKERGRPWRICILALAAFAMIPAPTILHLCREVVWISAVYIADCKRETPRKRRRLTKQKKAEAVLATLMGV